MPKKRVLFLCVGNSCRSQMAEGFVKHYGQGIIDAASAGTMPADRVQPDTYTVMDEAGISIAGQYPKELTQAMIENADILISMGCGVEKTCPAPLLKDFIDWQIEDPYGQGLEKYRSARDQIEKKVKDLIEELAGESA